MESSRIFIKGLPPTISEEEFRKHFSSRHAITDAKLIPHRRIGYVGYKTPEDAQKAVKYFNKTFIRMSKIGVEVARPVCSLPYPCSLLHPLTSYRSPMPLFHLRENNNASLRGRLSVSVRRRKLLPWSISRL